MTANEGIEKIQATVNSAAERLSVFGVSVKVVTRYMSAYFKTVTDAARAKYVTVSLVITADGIPDGDEYCLSLGAEIRRRQINGDILELDIEKYEKMVEDTEQRLGEDEDKAEIIKALANEASEEYEQLAGKVQASKKKQNIYTVISLVLFVVGVIILFLVSMYG